MYITEQYILLKAVHYYIENFNYRLINRSKNRDEYVLYKKEKKVNQFLRFKSSTFDWSNHLKKDIEQRITTILRQPQLLRGKENHLHFVYISDLTPVDDWERLKKVTPIKQPKPTNVSVYILDKNNRNEEWNAFVDRLGEGQQNFINDLPQTEEQERQTAYLEQKIQTDIFNKQKEFQQVFQYGKNRLTFLLLSVNILVFLAMEMSGSTLDQRHLINWGAKENYLIANGEWWRLFTSMFLHIGFIHLLMNMIALYYLGELTEKIYGTNRFFLIYSLAGLIGGLSSFAINDSIAAGASGAIFGLFGALLFFGIHYKEIFFRTMGINLIIVIGINIAFGLSVPQIDNSAHIGGLIGGFIASQAVHLPKKKSMGKQIAAWLIIIGLVIGLMIVGTAQIV